MAQKHKTHDIEVFKRLKDSARILGSTQEIADERTL